MQLLNTGVAVLALSAILVIAQKPFAPDLYDRDALELRFEERAATGSAKPYAPDLYVTEDLGDDIFLSFERSLEDNTSKLTKRDGSPSEAMDRNLLSRWNRNEHKHCKSDSHCGSGQYCSSKRNKCYKKRGKNSSCSRDAACGSGYCRSKTGKCDSKKRNHSHKCHHDDRECYSGYCSPKDNVCKPKKKNHERCVCDSGCQWGLECVNGKCENKREHNPHHNHHHHHPKPGPPRPQPSGTPWDPKPLQPRR